MFIKVVIFVILSKGGFVQVEREVPGLVYVHGKTPIMQQYQKCETLAHELFESTKSFVDYGPIQSVNYGCTQEYSI